MNFPRLLSAVVLLVSTLPLFATETGPVYVVPLQGEVSSSQFLFLRRALKEAERNHASGFVIDMQTYGGSVKAAIDNMDALLQTTLPTFTYINNKAISAGALIALATQKIYMAPTGVIGAAAPVGSVGEDLGKTMADKTISTVSAFARGAAQKAGHNPALADSFIRQDAQLKIGDTVIDGPDSLLTLNAAEATRSFDGKNLLAEGIAATLPDMLHMAGLTASVHHVDPTGFELLATYLTLLSPLLLFGGILGAVVEIKTPGFGLPGISSIICFTLFFTGSYVAGLAGWEAAVVFLIGLGLIVSEVFVHPGTILPGFVGLLLLIGALVWAMVDHYPGQPLVPSSAMLVRPLANLVIAVLFACVAIYLLARHLPGTPLYRRLVLAASAPSGGLLQTGHLQTGLALGATGIAHTMLRPSGKAEIDGLLVDVVSEGDFVDAGATLRVIAVEGTRIVVMEEAPEIITPHGTAQRHGLKFGRTPSRRRRSG